MHIIILIMLRFSIISLEELFSQQGACSWHGGVDCDRGPDCDGSVICQDGWKDSSVSYLSACGYFSFDADTLRIASYNLLRFSVSNGMDRLEYFRTIMQALDPDILVVQELSNDDGLELFQDSVLNYFNYQYSYVYDWWTDGDLHSGLFYKYDNIHFCDKIEIPTELRDIIEYSLIHNGIEFKIYSLHLKAGSTSEDKDIRLGMTTILREHLNDLSPWEEFIVVGDYNIQKCSEESYQELIESQEDNDGRLFDPIEQCGDWNDNPDYSLIHTQATRKKQFGGGAYGGLDDRFDFMLVSQSVLQPGGIFILADSYTAFGNDGNHLNMAVDSVVIQYLYNPLEVTDHFPVIIYLRI